MKVYDLFYKAKAPKGIKKKKAYIVGGGLAGLAAAATGFALNNPVLIVCGALDGGSGFILAVIMSKAMNRSFGNVLFGAFGAVDHAEGPAGKDISNFSMNDGNIPLGQEN